MIVTIPKPNRVCRYRLIGDVETGWRSNCLFVDTIGVEKIEGSYLSMLVLLDDVPFSVRVKVQPITASDVT